MAGGWATALGAAILGANQGYQDTKQLQFIRQRQLAADIRAQQEAADAHQAAIRAAILGQDQINELPKKHARDDMNAMLQVQGADAFNNPAFPAKANIAGISLGTPVDITKARVNDIESGNATPTLSNAQMAERLGVAPATGLPIPIALRAQTADLQRKSAMDAIQLKQMQDFANGGASGGYDIDPTTGLPANTAQNRMRELGDPFKRITQMYGPAADMPSNVKAKDTAAAEARATIPQATLQRVIGGMNETIDNLNRGQRALEQLYPGIEKANSADPNAPYNSTWDAAGAYLRRLGYAIFDSPYNKAIQPISLGNAQEWASLIPGRFNKAIIDKIQEHQGEYGKGQTPLNSYQRNKELIEMLTRNRSDLLAPVRVTDEPAAAPTPQQAASPEPMSVWDVEHPGVPKPPSAAPKTAVVASPPPPPKAAAPQPKPAAPPSAPKAAPAPVNAKGVTVTMSEILEHAKNLGIDPKVAVAQVAARGARIIDDTKPLTRQPVAGRGTSYR